MDDSDLPAVNPRHIDFCRSPGFLSPDVFWRETGLLARSHELSPVFVRRYRGRLQSDEPTFHTEWEIVAVRSGRGRLETNPTLTLEADRAYLLPPGLWHRERASRVELFWIGVTGTRLREIDPRLCAEVASPEAVSLAESLWRKAQQRHPGSGPELDGLTHALMGHLMYALANQPRVLDPLDVLLGELRRNYARIVSVSALAQRLGWSEGHFHRRFKQRTGVSPLAYLTEVRLRAAEALLARGGHTVSEAARAVGFTDPLYFSRVFRRVRGVTPSAARDKSR